jgi:hypothetical protein
MQSAQARHRNYGCFRRRLWLDRSAGGRILVEATVNRNVVDANMRQAPDVIGTLVWFYLPSRGRYILSLAPRSDLGFVWAGEVRGGTVSLTVDGDTLTLESLAPFAAGYAPYILYVLHDAKWKPTAEAQLGRFQMRSVAPAEITALGRQ